MKIYSGISILFLVMVFISCKNNNKDVVKDIFVKGEILDSVTGKPIANARVTLLGWRREGEEETYDKVDTITNIEGRFEAKFSEAFKVDIGCIAPSYHPIVKSVKDISRSFEVELKLNRNLATGVLKDLGQFAIYVRDYNTTPSETRTYHGLNILHGTNTQSSDSIDLDIEHYSEKGYPIVLVAPEPGGIVPFFDKSNVAITKAPDIGYVNSYKLNFKEKGFFVRCRDGKTYARLTIFSNENNYTAPFKNGSINDFGILFNVEKQTEGREFNSANDIRLDYYILENL